MVPSYNASRHEINDKQGAMPCIPVVPRKTIIKPRKTPQSSIKLLGRSSANIMTCNGGEKLVSPYPLEPPLPSFNKCMHD